MSTPDDSAQISTNIAIWGPPGSGKTWLIHALAKELSWYNDRDSDFSYSLVDDTGVRLYPSPPNSVDQGATMAPEDRVWTFERKGKKQSQAHIISTQRHNIIVHDDKGQNLVDAVTPFVGQSLTIETLRYSPNIIILLDPSTVKNLSISTPVPPPTVYEKHEYTELLLNLVNALAAQGVERHLAVCLSKSDLLNLILPVEEIVKACFGVDTLKVLQDPRIHTRFFRVSSVGFLRQPHGKKSPNITIEGKISNEEVWEPFNVVSPFFWLFEAIERARIGGGNTLFSDRGKIYLPYPRPRIK
ncbi:MAG: ATP-binding protein [Anaerolineales bacterium]|nr:ATP-binding protein [Anaerolineales bacterium]